MWGKKTDKDNLESYPPRVSLSNTKKITLGGETHSAKEWGRRLGIPGQTICYRLSKGYPVEQALAVKHFTVSVSPVAKKRVGESLYNSKLTDDMVRALRTDRGNGDTHKKLSVKYGVSQSVVSDILAGKTWSHVVDIPSSWREAYEVVCIETAVLA